MMKSAVAVALIMSLVGSAFPAAAQENTDTTAAPLARASTRAAIHLSAASVDGVQTSNSADVNWTGVLRLAPGTEIIVTVRGSAEPRKRYFVLAVGSTVTVLNLTAEALSAAATRLLREIAANHPEYFASTQRTAQFADQDVQVTPDGVFMAGRKITNLDQIVERIARADVVGVRRAQSWSRVRKLAPGTEVIVVTAQGSPTGNRYFVRADESNLTVLNLSDPALPIEVRRVLLDAASKSPEGLTSALIGGTFISNNLHVVPGGVFVADRKVIDLGQILERIPRTDLESGASSLAGPDQAEAKGLSAGAKIAIGATIAGAAFLIWLVARGPYPFGR